MANPTDYMNGKDQTFPALLANYPDYVCAISAYNRYLDCVMTIKGLLNTPRISFTFSNQEGHSSAIAIEDFQRGFIDSKVDSFFGKDENGNNKKQVSKKIREVLLNGLKTVATSAKTYTPGNNTIKFNLELFVDLHSSSLVALSNDKAWNNIRYKEIEGKGATLALSSNYKRNLFALNSLCAPYFEKSTLAKATEDLTNKGFMATWEKIKAGGISGFANETLNTVMNPGFVSPLMLPSVRANVTDHFLGGLLLNHDRFRLASLVIGTWLCIPGGLWPTSTDVELLTNVDATKSPLNGNFRITLEYYIQPDLARIMSWFPETQAGDSTGKNSSLVTSTLKTARKRDKNGGPDVWDSQSLPDGLQDILNKIGISAQPKEEKK